LFLFRSKNIVSLASTNFKIREFILETKLNLKSLPPPIYGKLAKESLHDNFLERHPSFFSKKRHFYFSTLTFGFANYFFLFSPSLIVKSPQICD